MSKCENCKLHVQRKRVPSRSNVADSNGMVAIPRSDDKFFLYLFALSLSSVLLIPGLHPGYETLG
jgi:hypothetical protein